MDSPVHDFEAVKVRQAGHDLNGQLPAEGCVARHRQVSEGLPNTEGCEGGFGNAVK